MQGMNWMCFWFTCVTQFECFFLSPFLSGSGRPGIFLVSGSLLLTPMWKPLVFVLDKGFVSFRIQMLKFFSEDTQWISNCSLSKHCSHGIKYFIGNYKLVQAIY